MKSITRASYNLYAKTVPYKQIELPSRSLCIRLSHKIVQVDPYRIHADVFWPA